MYLKLYQPAKNAFDYHLQAEVFKEKWREIKNRSFPWQVCLQPSRLLLLEGTITEGRRKKLEGRSWKEETGRWKVNY
ncbi:hypothetical protein [Okeania sp. SIO2B9]|uniref:hypothetical protein n=1 Tax=Okeania sp. SIO2B9 TaxID=2607782 RepID=UPI00338E6CFB